MNPDRSVPDADDPATLDIDTLVVAGWTGRDVAGVEHHIRELEALGVAPPSSVPLFYRVSASLLAHVGRIEVVGTETSGEAEPLLVRQDGTLWLGLASDHTDRALEAHSVALSKQVCAKPRAAGLWRFDEVADRLDTLELRSWIPDGNGGWTLYQDGTLAALRPLAELLAASPLAGRSGGEGTARAAMLCGTLPAIGGVRAADAFRLELVDPAANRSLRHEYAVSALPVVA